MENEFNDNLDFKSLENFCSKEINTSLTPQEMMVMSLSLSHVAQVLNLYNQCANIAIFDVKKFIVEHPEFADVDFNNLDNDTVDAMRKIFQLDSKNNKNEEFNTGDILIKNIINIAISIGTKLVNSYSEEYNTVAPEDTTQFFGMLENCLNGALKIMQAFFMSQSY